MKRYYDIFINFTIDTENDTFGMCFSSDWKFTEMLDYMCDRFDIDRDHILEIKHTFIKRYKVAKDV